MSSLVQFLLPVYDEGVARELTDRFGGLTAYARSPARGLWEDDGDVKRDDIIVYEVMVDELDTDWWSAYRKSLEQRFDQKEVVVRAWDIRRI